jgi:predicted DNA binding CopG/RHH family protein
MEIEKRILPDFKSEAEEAKWWFDNQNEILKDFERAAEEGRLGRGPVPQLTALPTTTIRLDPADIELARKQAARKGLKYQTYLKMVIHEALLKEAQASDVHGTEVPAAA